MYRPLLFDVLSPTTLDMATLAALPSAASQPDPEVQPGYGRVVAVEPIGDPALNGAALRKSLAGIAPAAGARCLLTIAPGIYDLGGLPLQMKPHVDIVGAGERVTLLTAQIDSSAAGTIIGADDAELRGLTVSNSGGGTCAVAIYNDAVAPRLERVTANASGARGNYGVYNCNGATPMLTYVIASAGGGSCNTGIYNDGSAPTLTHVSASASGGNVSYGIYNFDGSAPTLTDVIATASGADRNVGLYNEESFPTAVDVLAYASGGVHNIDVYSD